MMSTNLLSSVNKFRFTYRLDDSTLRNRVRTDVVRIVCTSLVVLMPYKSDHVLTTGHCLKPTTGRVCGFVDFSFSRLIQS